jgi:TatD DNase family protein
VLARAKAAGVDHMIAIGTDLPDDEKTIALCRKLPNVRCAIGIHPNHSAHATVADVERLRALQADPVVLALGEMGLDYNHDNSPRDHQRKIFEAQMQLATELNKPVVIHCREAVDNTLAMMKAFPKVRAVVHCFTGTSAEAKRIVEAGYYLGYTGVVTFKKSDDLREAVRLTPLDRLLVETDAPYLTPEPMRKQKTNEPALVVHTAMVVANVLGVPLDELDQLTTENTVRLFDWDL